MSLERDGVTFEAWIEDIQRATGPLLRQLIHELMQRIDEGEFDEADCGRCSSVRHGGEREGRQHRQDR